MICAVFVLCCVFVFALLCVLFCVAMFVVVCVRCVFVGCLCVLVVVCGLFLCYDVCWGALCFQCVVLMRCCV